ncbi:calcium and integrin-binding family member 3 isoform X1 [Bombyx mori]|uniref:EF-hand domain-containing protein n=2 Tax=Bombyx mori TaxID=7091 RepID=A0A8R2LVP3_BOMMO|nr:calcium and integrin-binding family member 3 isoform X1 [Bombyx mori]
MLKVACVIIIFYAFLYHSEALPSDLCRIRPKDKHCLIEYMARNRWSHQIRVFKRFREVNPDLIPKRMTENQAHTIAVPVEEIEKLPELKENPFKRRICQVFSHDGSGNLTFEDFLDMMSVFSEAAPRDIKAWYAFRIYDLDDDMYIGREDLLEATRLLTKGELHAQEREEIVASVLDEADVDGDGRLSFMDFEHVVVRAPDFLSTFHIRV